MIDLFTLEAEVRTDLGKGASRRLRHANKVPAILYGEGQEPVSLTLEHKNVFRAQQEEAFYSQVLTLNIDGKPVECLIKDMQRHPYKQVVMHMDFMRVDDKHEIVMNIPLHFEGGEESPAGKSSRVILDYQSNEVEISCFPKDLPEFITVDVSTFDAGDNLHLSDLKLPEGVTLTAFTHGDDTAHDAVVVSTSVVGEKSEPEDGEEAPAAEGDEEA